MASKFRAAKEQEIIDLCQSPEFSLKKTAERRSDQANENIMQEPLFPKPHACYSSWSMAYLTSSCFEARCREGRQVANPGRMPYPWQSPRCHGGPVARLVLTAEFKPFQEVDVMAKVAGFIKRINVDVGESRDAGHSWPPWRFPKFGRPEGGRMPRSCAARADSHPLPLRKDEQHRAEPYITSLSLLSTAFHSGGQKARPGRAAGDRRSSE